MLITDGRASTAYSYWPNLNMNSTKVYVHDVNGEPAVYDFDPVSFTLGPKRAMFEGERCSREDAIWSGTDANEMLCHDLDGNIKSYNVETRVWRTIKSLPDVPHTWQMSRSIDDRRFAFTTKDESYANTGWIVYDRSTDEVFRHVTKDVDEVQLDKSGRYLVHKTGKQGEGQIEVIVNDLDTGRVTELLDNEPHFAPGHSDNGTGKVFGADNWQNRLLARDLANPTEFQTLLQWPSWDGADHTSALADDEDWILVSRYGSTGASAFANEIFQLATDGSGRVRHLVHHQMTGSNYSHLPRATISRDGRFVTFTSNWGRDVGDVFLAKVE